MIYLTKEKMQKYIEKKLPNAKIIRAAKKGNTHAVPGTIGQEVITYSTDSNGNEIVEKVQVVTLDSQTHKPGWILTKLDEHNQPDVNKNGHLNQYIVSDSAFTSMYVPSDDGQNLYSKTQIELFIQLDEDITFGTRHGEMTIMSGGYAKITRMDKITGVSYEDFNDTYVVIDTIQEKTLT